MLRIFDKNKEIKYDINKYLTEIFPLENFSAFGLIMDGIYFKTGEHAFQYLKFKDEKIRKEIINCNNPYEARMLGRKYKKQRINNWTEVKYEYLKKIFKLKLEQNQIVKEALVKTKDYLICEYCIDEDTEWGLDKNGFGENRLGKTWMKIREEEYNTYNQN